MQVQGGVDKPYIFVSQELSDQATGDDRVGFLHLCLLRQEFFSVATWLNF